MFHISIGDDGAGVLVRHRKLLPNTTVVYMKSHVLKILLPFAI
jgi:hypothetical protein